MIKCPKCRNPLTEFEVSFHRHANLPPELSNKCCSCLNVGKGFEKPISFSRYIITCLIGIAILVIGCLIALPILCDHYDINIDILISRSNGNWFLIFQEIVEVTGLNLFSGLIPTITIFYSKRKLFLSPKEEHITSSYWTSSHHEGTFSDDGKTLTIKKVTETDSSSTNNWVRPKKVDGLREDIRFILWALKLGAAITSAYFFPIWCVPYLILTIMASLLYPAYKKLKIPSELSNAYKTSYKYLQNAPITFEHKVRFLKTKEKYTEKVKKQATPKTFFDTFNTSQSAYNPPYTSVKFNKLQCMIVDYVKHIDYGVTFVLIKNSMGDFDKKMVIGGNFIHSDGDTWEQDWREQGAREETIKNIEIYQNIFRNI